MSSSSSSGDTLSAQDRAEEFLRSLPPAVRRAVVEQARDCENEEEENTEEEETSGARRSPNVPSTPEDSAAGAATTDNAAGAVLLQQMMATQTALVRELQKLQRKDDALREEMMKLKEEATRGKELKDTDIPEGWRELFLTAVVNGYEVEERMPQWLFILSSQEAKELSKKYPKLSSFDVKTLQHGDATFNAFSKEKKEVDKLMKEVMMKVIMSCASSPSGRGISMGHTRRCRKGVRLEPVQQSKTLFFMLVTSSHGGA